MIEGAGAQALSPSIGPEAFQNPGAPTPVGSFNITQLSSLGSAYAAGDKIGKDTNFRGLTIYNNVVYYTKGSGGNGVNPSISSTRPERPARTVSAYRSRERRYRPLRSPTTRRTSPHEGVFPYNMCILAGFPTVLAAAASGVSYPFGIWFANPDTIYLADEGSGDSTYDATSNTYTVAAADTTAGLQKWVFNSTTKAWKLAYTLQSGLQLGVPYTVAGYPTGDNTGTFGTGLPWAPATDGLRNITGRVNRNGTATIWAVTSTVSGSGDQGADPNKVVAITDPLAATTPGSHEAFTTVEAAKNGEILRGVSFTPERISKTSTDDPNKSRGPPTDAAVPAPGCSTVSSCGSGRAYAGTPAAARPPRILTRPPADRRSSRPRAGWCRSPGGAVLSRAGLRSAPVPRGPRGPGEQRRL